MQNDEATLFGRNEGSESEKLSHAEAPKKQRGLTCRRLYTTPGIHPFDMVGWELRTAIITNEKGETIFEQADVEVPSSWSMTATNVVVSKYFTEQ